MSRVRAKASARYQGTVAGGAVKPGDSVVILPSGMVANVKQIVTFGLVRNAAVRGDAITLVLDRQVDVARGDMIATIDAQPQVGLAFDAQLVALQPGGIEPGKRYWLKSGSRRQRVTVQPSSLLDLKSGKWNRHDGALPMNAIGKVHLSFDEAAIFDAYELNRTTGAFILIDPDTNNTVAGGMIAGKRGDVGGSTTKPSASSSRSPLTSPTRSWRAASSPTAATKSTSAAPIRAALPSCWANWIAERFTPRVTEQGRREAPFF